MRNIEMHPSNGSSSSVTIGATVLFFSYRTLVGVRLSNGKAFKFEHSPSVTVSKHINSFGLRNAEPVSEATLADVVFESLRAETN